MKRSMLEHLLVLNQRTGEIDVVHRFVLLDLVASFFVLPTLHQDGLMPMERFFKVSDPMWAERVLHVSRT